MRAINEIHFPYRSLRRNPLTADFVKYFCVCILVCMYKNQSEVIRDLPRHIYIYKYVFIHVNFWCVADLWKIMFKCFLNSLKNM